MMKRIALLVLVCLVALPAQAQTQTDRIAARGSISNAQTTIITGSTPSVGSGAERNKRNDDWRQRWQRGRKHSIPARTFADSATE
jgi:hypothetical protein